MDSKGQIGNLAGVIIGALIFLIVFVAVFGQIFAVTTGILQPNTNVFISTGFDTGVLGLLDIMPLVLIGAALIVIVVIGFRLGT